MLKCWSKRQFFDIGAKLTRHTRSNKNGIRLLITVLMWRQSQQLGGMKVRNSAHIPYELSIGVNQRQNQFRAWVLFFTALHDLGKFDVRFQLKAPNALAAAWRPLGKEDHGLSLNDITRFDHGWAGMAWANQEYQSWLGYDRC